VAAIKNNKTLLALTSAALALPGMAPRTALSLDIGGLEIGDIEGGFQYSHYEEGDDRINADTYQGTVTLPLTGRLNLNGHWIVDAWSGATPSINVPSEVLGRPDGDVVQILTSASPETRVAFDLRAGYQFDDVLLEFGGGSSDERDYDSTFFNFRTAWDLNEKQTTLSLGLNYQDDDIEAVTRPDLHGQKSVYNIQVGVTQVLSKDSLITSTFGYTRSSGFLSNPYKRVFIQDLGAFFEQRPDNRNSWVWDTRYIRHLAAWDAALHLDYRLFADDWGVHAHTFEAAWYQPLGHDWQVVPRVRYYSQNDADFYQPFFTQEEAADEEFSSDHRLAGFGAISGGAVVTKDWADWLNFETSFEYYQRYADLEIGGDGESDFADYNFWLVNVAVKIKF